jgi:hypothetical protein
MDRMCSATADTQHELSAQCQTELLAGFADSTTNSCAHIDLDQRGLDCTRQPPACRYYRVALTPPFLMLLVHCVATMQTSVKPQSRRVLTGYCFRDADKCPRHAYSSLVCFSVLFLWHVFMASPDPSLTSHTCSPLDT